jgi:predicted O-methyltransferase YrrM
MYSSFQLAVKYVKYFFTASNGKGHGVHSPFVFNFIAKIMNDKKNRPAYKPVEAIRKQMLVEDTLLTIEDYGAGSTVSKTNERKVRDIAKSALKPTKFGQLFHRVVDHYKPSTIIELGTSLGVTTSYFATGNPAAKVYTFEGATQIANIARKNFEKNSLANIRLVEGDFDNTLQKILPNITTIDLAFVDGNHRKDPTINYFEQLLKKANENSIFIFDDIHWSKEMEEAWAYIKEHPSVTLTIDLFFIGFVFFRKEQKIQQHFKVRF